MDILYTWSQCLGSQCGLVCEKIFEFWVLGQIPQGKRVDEQWDLVIFSRFLSYSKFQKFDLKKFEFMDMVYTWLQCLG